MKPDIQLQLAGLSLRTTVSLLTDLGTKGSPKAVHEWVQKADLQTTEGSKAESRCDRQNRDSNERSAILTIRYGRARHVRPVESKIFPTYLILAKIDGNF